VLVAAVIPGPDHRPPEQFDVSQQFGPAEVDHDLAEELTELSAHRV
jgi:hypothetical protein